MTSTPNQKLHRSFSQVSLSPTQIGGFSLSTCIGKGSFSTVFKAHKDRGKYQVVAIKCITMSNLSAQSKDNLISEINILKKIDHEHIVSMKNFTWDSKYIYIILDYCPGGNLAEFIASKGFLSERFVQHFAQQLVKGLHCLYRENVIHSDLKPENILLSSPPVGACRNVKLKIADFGFSRRLSSDQKYVNGIKGSPRYMAPEVLRMKPYCAQADLYSLGTVLFECLFGHAPYKTNDLDTLCFQILSPEPIKVPKKIHLSDSCIDLIEGLLVKEPSNRFTFEELYSHSFIDIEHCPTRKNYFTGAEIIKRAILLDAARENDKARAHYVKGLSYLLPAYYWLETFNDIQRKILNQRIREYCWRAEQLASSNQSPPPSP